METKGDAEQTPNRPRVFGIDLNKKGTTSFPFPWESRDKVVHGGAVRELSRTDGS